MNEQPTDELRRLRAQVLALREAVDRAATAIEQVDENGHHPSAWELGKVLTSLFAVMNDTKPPRHSEPVWIQRDHLQKAREAPFLCRVEPTPRETGFVPLYEVAPELASASAPDLIEALKKIAALENKMS